MASLITCMHDSYPQDATAWINYSSQENQIAKFALFSCKFVFTLLFRRKDATYKPTKDSITKV